MEIYKQLFENKKDIILKNLEGFRSSDFRQPSNDKIDYILSLPEKYGLIISKIIATSLRYYSSAFGDNDKFVENVNKIVNYLKINKQKPNPDEEVWNINTITFNDLLQIVNEYDHFLKNGLKTSTISPYIIKFPNKWRWVVVLIDKGKQTDCHSPLEKEAMNHCGSIAQGSRMFSLRDDKNIPHLTLNLKQDTKNKTIEIIQLRGKNNSAIISSKYINYFESFMAYYKKLNYKIIWDNSDTPPTIKGLEIKSSKNFLDNFIEQYEITEFDILDSGKVKEDSMLSKKHSVGTNYYVIKFKLNNKIKSVINRYFISKNYIGNVDSFVKYLRTNETIVSTISNICKFTFNVDIKRKFNKMKHEDIFDKLFPFENKIIDILVDKLIKDQNIKDITYTLTDDYKSNILESVINNHYFYSKTNYICDLIEQSKLRIVNIILENKDIIEKLYLQSITHTVKQKLDPINQLVNYFKEFLKSYTFRNFKFELTQSRELDNRYIYTFNVTNPFYKYLTMTTSITNIKQFTITFTNNKNFNKDFIIKPSRLTYEDERVLLNLKEVNSEFIKVINKGINSYITYIDRL